MLQVVATGAYYLPVAAQNRTSSDKFQKDCLHVFESKQTREDKSFWILDEKFDN